VGDLELPKIDAAQMGMPSAPSYGLHQQPHIQTNVAAQTGCLHVENSHNTDTTEAPKDKAPDQDNVRAAEGTTVATPTKSVRLSSADITSTSKAKLATESSPVPALSSTPETSTPFSPPAPTGLSLATTPRNGLATPEGEGESNVCRPTSGIRLLSTVERGDSGATLVSLLSHTSSREEEGGPASCTEGTNGSAGTADGEEGEGRPLACRYTIEELMRIGQLPQCRIRPPNLHPYLDKGCKPLPNRPCKYWSRSRRCPAGHACPFRHSEEELWLPDFPPISKAQGQVADESDEVLMPGGSIGRGPHNVTSTGPAETESSASDDQQSSGETASMAPPDSRSVFMRASPPSHQISQTTDSQLQPSIKDNMFYRTQPCKYWSENRYRSPVPHHGPEELQRRASDADGQDGSAPPAAQAVEVTSAEGGLDSSAKADDWFDCDAEQDAPVLDLTHMRKTDTKIGGG